MRETFLSITSLADVFLWRDGGQRGARRNAWAAMVVDNARARARAEAEHALTVASPAVTPTPAAAGH